MSARICVLIVATTVALAGCGSEKTYVADATRSCLTASSATISVDDWDFVTESASGGSYAATLPSSNALAFGFFGSSSDAQEALVAYKSAIDANGSSDALVRRGNVMLTWLRAPTSGDRRLVEDCLRS